MRKINYSELDLNGFTLRELQRICRYYDLEYSDEKSKEELIQMILEYSPPELVQRTLNLDYVYHYFDYQPEVILPAVVVTKSVRIQKIEEERNKVK